MPPILHGVQVPNGMEEGGREGWIRVVGGRGGRRGGVGEESEEVGGGG